VAIDDATWSGLSTPAARWTPGRRFFKPDADPGDVLVAEVAGVVAGYVKLGTPSPLASGSHVLEIQALAVAPAQQRRGVGRDLLAAAIEAATERGARRLTLRVLATNAAARRLYSSMGFEVEGVLRGEFLIDGSYVDDVLMAARVGDRPNRAL